MAATARCSALMADMICSGAFACLCLLTYGEFWSLRYMLTWLNARV